MIPGVSILLDDGTEVLLNPSTAEDFHNILAAATGEPQIEKPTKEE